MDILSVERTRWISVAMLIHLTMALLVVVQMSYTTDEENHLEYGRRILNGQSTSELSLYERPVMALTALPAAAGRRLEGFRAMRPLAALLSTKKLARCVTVAVSLLLCYLLAIWSELLYGTAAMRAALILYAFSPNILAHATLSTSDLYAGIGVCLALFGLFRFLQNPGWRTTLLASGTLALAQLTKFSAFWLLPFSIVLLVMICGTDLVRLGHLPREWKLMVYYPVIAALFTILMLQGIFSVQGSPATTRMSKMTFESPGFQKLGRIPYLSDLPIPIPADFIKGIDSLSQDDRTGRTYGNIYLLGEVRGPHAPSFDPFRSYYLVVYFFKQPVTLQILLLFGLIRLALRRTLHEFLRSEACIVIPMIGFAVISSFFQHAQVGIRHILPSLALAVVVSSSWFANWEEASRRWKMITLGLFCYLAVSVFAYFPHMIPYTNEFITDKRQTFRFFADSNLSWSQNFATVQSFLKNNPDVQLNPTNVHSGRVLVDVNALVGIQDDRYKELRTLQPVAHVGYAHVLFQVP